MTSALVKLIGLLVHYIRCSKNTQACWYIISALVKLIGLLVHYIRSSKNTQACWYNISALVNIYRHAGTLHLPW